MQSLARLFFLALLCAGANAHAAALSDGPYVVSASGAPLALSVVDGQKRAEPVAANAVITVPAVGALPAFSVRLRPPAANAPDAVQFSSKLPLLVIADTHGEYEILAQMLMAQKVVDARLRWRFGRGHLVVLGDVFDRGPNHLEILWLLYELQAQAAKAGGGVHLVLGNHETMVMRGDLRYLHPKYVDSAGVLGVRSYADLFGTDTVLGQWLRTRPVVFSLNDLLCLHGGISRALLDRELTLSDINGAVRAALSGPLSDPRSSERAEFLMSAAGPLWYRGYFPGQADFTPASSEDVDLTLTRFGVSRVLVGHTVVPAITSLYDAKVIAVQVYPRRDDSGRVSFEALLIRGGRLSRVTPDGAALPL